MKRKIIATKQKIYTYVRMMYKTITRTIMTHPVQSFFGVIGVFFALVIIGSIIGKPKTNNLNTTVIPKSVSIHTIGKSPRVQMTAQVETNGVVKIVAQSTGIVSQVYVREGTTVQRGDWILSLASNYQGSSIPSITRQIAQKNYEFVSENYDAQKSIIDKQREIADHAQDQSTDTRNITRNSIADTKNLIELDQQIIDALSKQIAEDEATNTGGSKDQLILQTKQAKAGAQAGINSLRVALANAEYQVDDAHAPAGIANGQHDLTLAQLELQQKSLDLNRELSVLNLRVAQASEAMMNPASPIAGVVERVNINVGQQVTSGTVIATITGVKKSSSVVLLVPESIAKSISRLETSTINVGSQSFDIAPHYISTQPTDGLLYSVLYRVPEDKEQLMSAGSTVIVSVPVGGNMSTSAVPIIPIDAVYQTQEESYVYIATQSGKDVYTASARQITLGQSFGSFVEVLRGLSMDAAVIISRNIVAGDTVTF
jgi:multidrug efflux pump subunit AcrA (membrane-fusion protein)